MRRREELLHVTELPCLSLAGIKLTLQELNPLLELSLIRSFRLGQFDRFSSPLLDLTRP